MSAASFKGSGMPLPSFFYAILNPLRSAEMFSLAENRDAIRAACQSKDAAVSVTYPNSSDPWGEFINEGVSFLVDSGIVKIDSGVVSKGPEFRIGAAMPDVLGMSIRLFTEDDNKISHRAAEMECVYNELKPEGPGWRDTDENRVNEIAGYMSRFGYLKQFPITIDKKRGHIIDGRHRLLAAKKASVDPVYNEIDIESVEDGIAIAWCANVGSGWRKRDEKKLAKRLLLSGITPDVLGDVCGEKGKRAVIGMRLRENPDWSNNRLATTYGYSDHTFSEVRKELESTSQIAKLDKLLGSDGKWRPAAAPAGSEDNKTAKPQVEYAGKYRDGVESALIRNPSRANRDISDEIGCNKREVRRVRHELETKGVLESNKPRIGRDGREVKVYNDIEEIKQVVIRVKKRGVSNEAIMNAVKSALGC